MTTPNRRSGLDRRSQPASVVLVDEEAMTRAGVARILTDGGIKVVGQCASGEEAIEMVIDLNPDVVVTGLSLPRVSGLELIAQICLLAPLSRILVHTRSKSNLVVEAIVAGASGYILKSAQAPAVLHAVTATAAGECVLSPEIAGKLLDRLRERQETPAVAAGAAEAIRAALTARELEIFQLLASGRSNSEIGRELSLSMNTVSNHIKNILAKLQLDNRIQAAVHAVRSGIS